MIKEKCIIDEKETITEKFGYGLEKAYTKWLESNTDRRFERMVKKGEVPVRCSDENGKNIPSTNAGERRYLLDTPLFMIPGMNVHKLVKKVGDDEAKDLLMKAERFNKFGEKRHIDEYTPWNQASTIKMAKELKENKYYDLEMRRTFEIYMKQKHLRMRMVNSWLKNSNVYNVDKDDGFLWEVESIQGYKRMKAKASNSSRLVDHYLVIYEPRVLPPDVVYPEDLPAVIGKPWIVTEDNWCAGNELKSLRNNAVFKEQMEHHKFLYSLWDDGE